jgi:outer membrane protein assembly factor BamB
VIERSGQQMIIGQTQKNLFAISPENGKMFWVFNYGALAGLPDHDNIQVNTPLYSDGRIFSSNGYGHSSVMLELAQDGNSVKQLWSENVMDTHLGGNVLINGYIYGSNWLNNAKGKWVCLDWNTGKLMYESEWINKGSVIAGDEMLYCYEEKSGNIALVKPSPEKFEVISSFKVPFGSGPHWSHPVISKGVLYIRHGDSLMAYKIK